MSHFTGIEARLSVVRIFSFAVVGLIVSLALGPAWSKAKAKRPAVAGSPASASASASAPGAEEVDGEELVDIGTRDVLERLKLLRVQMALDREEIAALDLRIEKIKKEREMEALLGTGTSKPTARTRSAGTDILVKAITLQPRKEAVIMYRGRIFSVREGDKIGGVVVTDINESGLKVKRRGGGVTSTVR